MHLALLLPGTKNKALQVSILRTTPAIRAVSGGGGDNTYQVDIKTALIGTGTGTVHVVLTCHIRAAARVPKYLYLHVASMR